MKIDNLEQAINLKDVLEILEEYSKTASLHTFQSAIPRVYGSASIKTCVLVVPEIQKFIKQTINKLEKELKLLGVELNEE
jgi:hypothetical protein